MSSSPKFAFHLKTKLFHSPLPSNPQTKTKLSIDSSSSSSRSSFNIWPTKTTSIREEDFLKLYKHRYLRYVSSQPSEKNQNLEIIQNVYQLVGEKTFKLVNWRDFALEKQPQRNALTKKPTKLSVFGMMNAEKSGKTSPKSPLSPKSPKRSISPKKKTTKLPLLNKIKVKGKKTELLLLNVQ